MIQISAVGHQSLLDAPMKYQSEKDLCVVEGRMSSLRPASGQRGKIKGGGYAELPGVDRIFGQL